MSPAVKKLCNKVASQGGKVLKYEPGEMGTFIDTFMGVGALLRFEVVSEEDSTVTIGKSCDKTVPDSDYESDTSEASSHSSNNRNKDQLLNLTDTAVASLMAESASVMSTLNEEVLEEIEALEAIYPCGDGSLQFVRLGGTRTCLIMGQSHESTVTLQCTFPAHYPSNESLEIALHSAQGLTNGDIMELVEELDTLCQGNWEGAPQLFNVALHLQTRMAIN